jgi:hypothetical protein
LPKTLAGLFGAYAKHEIRCVEAGSHDLQLIRDIGRCQAIGEFTGQDSELETAAEECDLSFEHWVYPMKYFIHTDAVIITSRVWRHIISERIDAADLKHRISPWWGVPLHAHDPRPWW